MGDIRRLKRLTCLTSRLSWSVDGDFDAFAVNSDEWGTGTERNGQVEALSWKKS